MIRSGANSALALHFAAGSSAPPSPFAPFQNLPVFSSCSSGRTAPFATGTSQRPARLAIFSAFSKPASAVMFPATTVIASTCSSGELNASSIASASSVPGSVSRITFFGSPCCCPGAAGAKQQNPAIVIATPNNLIFLPPHRTVRNSSIVNPPFFRAINPPNTPPHFSGHILARSSLAAPVAACIIRAAVHVVAAPSRYERQEDRNAEMFHRCDRRFHRLQFRRRQRRSPTARRSPNFHPRERSRHRPDARGTD